MTDLHAPHEGPDLLDHLAEHEAHVCDYRTGYLAALRQAAAYVADYGHHLDRADVARIQAPILRAVTIADCPDCNLHGCVVDEHGRHHDHHPTTKGAA